MNLTEKLGGLTRISTQKRVSNVLILALGLLGLMIIGTAIWLSFTDWRHSGLRSSAESESRQAIEDLAVPVKSLKRIMNDEQVQILALRALKDEHKLADLRAYLGGRLTELADVQVFGSDLSAVRPAELGPNGYALFELLSSTLENNQGLMQIHNVLQPPRLFDAAVINQEGEAKGVIVLALEPVYLLKGFNPEIGSVGIIRLTQNNGRQPASLLAEWGDPDLLGEVPTKTLIAGTLFRLETPLQMHVGLIGTGMALLIIVAGLFCLLASGLLYRSNKKWLQEDAGNGTKTRSMVEPPVVTAEAQPEPRPEPAPLRPTPEPEEKIADPAQQRAKPEPADEDFAEQASDPEIDVPPPMRLQYDIAERRKLREAKHTPVELTPEIFRAYDIRGVIDKTLDSGIAKNVGQVVGTLALEKNAGPVVVARDGRLSGPYLMEGMIEGIVSTGCDVLDIGAVPTGVLYYAAHEMAAGSGVMITGSHNPPDYNGFKIMIAGDTLYGDAISAFYERIRVRDLKIGEGEVRRQDVVPDYIKRIADDVSVERELKVVIDCGNGIGAVCAADALRALGVEVLPLFDEVDGTFPNHHPDPSDPENLVDLIESVRLMDADLGLAFDGDADRLGVVTLAGNIIYPDRVMMLLALDVLDRNPGATIIYDVKCTSHLPRVIKEAGGNPVMYKTGHSLIKARMKEIGSPFAGEMSGHFFFGERWYGVDDGIYAAARLLEILGSTEAPPEAILNALPTSFSTPELKVQMKEGENHAFVEAFKQSAQFEGANISTIDGLRADFDDGWGLVRASNTTPILVVRFDAETEEALVRIKAAFRSKMLEVNPSLELNF
ncbi:MAG: phosphomannomutase/phosphoglucomutase [Xanthomonadales bacterium]|jgi:phosphomannomutase|nr:phosphomannomutase/phosphoglucomutase [Xanthomonadales bacterium]MDH3999763.1 phosphomannomutase/phosphoglucomutase [Xanthomonadales bacterium]